MFGRTARQKLKICSCVLMLAFCSVPFQSLGQTENLFIELIGESDIRVGYFETASFRKIETQRFDFHTDSLISSEKFFLQKTVSDTSVTLFYFHAMWGNQSDYNRKILKRLNKMAGVDRIVTVLWHANKVGYVANWERSYKTGKYFSPLFEQIFKQQKGEKSILCHSMGHRIFEGIVSEFQTDSLLFDDVIFAAADLDADIFEKNLSHLPKISNEIHVLVHQKDRLLKASKLRHGRDRLGLNGIANSKNLSKNIREIDVTNAPNSKMLSFSNHIYFVQNQSVYSDIVLIIGGKVVGE